MEPLSLSALGAETLTMGIQFLYSQAGEILKRWRQRREGEEPDASVPTASVGGTALQEEPKDLTIDYAALERLGGEIRDFRASLVDFAEGVEVVSPENVNLLRVTDGLRAALERVLSTELTLRGEDRPESAPDVGVRLSVDDVSGYVAGIRARELIEGRVRVDVKAGRVLPNSEVIGADFTAE